MWSCHAAEADQGSRQLKGWSLQGGEEAVPRSLGVVSVCSLSSPWLRSGLNAGRMRSPKSDSGQKRAVVMGPVLGTWEVWPSQRGYSSSTPSAHPGHPARTWKVSSFGVRASASLSEALTEYTGETVWRLSPTELEDLGKHQKSSADNPNKAQNQIRTSLE